MTENDNQKLDLIIKMIEQHDKRFDQHDKKFEQIEKKFEQIEQARKEDRAEWRRAREEDRAEWRSAREEDQAEWRRIREEDQAEWRKAREEDRAEIARQFNQQDKRFDQQDKRFDQQDKRFDQIIDLIRDEKHEREKMEAKLEKVYETRHEVKYKIDRDFILKNMGWNLGIIIIGITFLKFVIL